MPFNSNIKPFLQKLLPLLLGLLLSNTTNAFSLKHPIDYPITKDVICYTQDSTASHRMLLEINGYEVDGKEEIDMGANTSGNTNCLSKSYASIHKKIDLFKVRQNLTVKTNIYILYGRIGAG